MTDVTEFPRKERRHVKQRLLWIAPPRPVLESPTLQIQERRIDDDGANAADEIAAEIRSGNVAGIVFGILKSDGKIELGCTGTLYDNPLIASGVSNDLRAMIDGWREHPANYIPHEDTYIEID